MKTLEDAIGVWTTSDSSLEVMVKNALNAARVCTTRRRATSPSCNARSES
jgi:hypothetical protein